MVCEMRKRTLEFSRIVEKKCWYYTRMTQCGACADGLLSAGVKDPWEMGLKSSSSDRGGKRPLEYK